MFWGFSVTKNGSSGNKLFNSNVYIFPPRDFVRLYYNFQGSPFVSGRSKTPQRGHGILQTGRLRHALR